MSNITETFNLEEFKLSPEEKFFYRHLSESLEDPNSNKTPGEIIEEGVLGGILGGISGAVIAPSIMKSVCKVLGISENGSLGQLLTSKLVLAAIGAQLGSKL